MESLLAFLLVIWGGKNWYVCVHKGATPALYRSVFCLFVWSPLPSVVFRFFVSSSTRQQRREIGISRKDKSEKPQNNNNT
jgi:hypothetical protein